MKLTPGTRHVLRAAVFNEEKTNHRLGFTLIELIIVIATAAILFSMLLPAMGKARIKSTGAGCLSNLRQMMVGWAMYKDDNKDTLLPNAPLSGSALNETWCSGFGVNWTTAPGNTNASTYKNSLLGPYVANRIELYRCPADIIPSDNGRRIRSYSMNGQMGAAYYTGALLDGAYNVGWRVYKKGSDLNCPKPKDAYIFADESMASLNDGFFQNRLTIPQFPDVPAAYHEGAGSFSFGDGHAELHPWSGVLLSIPYRYGVVQNSVAASALDPDWRWLTNHAGCKR